MSLETDIRSMVESVGMNLYDTVITSENGDTIFRVNITSQNIVDGKREGVTLDQCVEVTKLISPLLDVEDPVSGNYRLEVSSPGIERKLKTLSHFEQSIGDKIKLTTMDKEKLRGELISVEGNELTFKNEDAQEVKVDFNSVLKAATYFDYSF